MLIAGAGGFARQVLSSLHVLNLTKELVFFDDVSPRLSGLIPDYFKVITGIDEAAEHLLSDPRFVLALGGSLHRMQMCLKLESIGGLPHTIVDPSVRLLPYQVNIGPGATILQDALLEPGVNIAKGALVNVRAIVSHDCSIGDFTEISPAATLLGGVSVGKNCMIGAGAILLPRIKVGDNVVIGAGAVVTENVGDGETRVGVPARQINKL
jgi:sugar O-acyltransferase (sialic acid O-acetyltransferase NeuD family)